MRFSWRKFLPIVNGLLAVGLLALGNFQMKQNLTEIREKGIAAEYDYIAPAQVWLMVIDAPAFVLSLPFTVLPMKSRFAAQTGFVVAVILLWYWIGRQIDERTGHLATPHSGMSERRVLRLEGFGLIVGLVLVSIAADNFVRGPWPRIIGISFALWALVLGFFFIGRLRISGRRIAQP